MTTTSSASPESSDADPPLEDEELPQDRPGEQAKQREEESRHQQPHDPVPGRWWGPRNTYRYLRRFFKQRDEMPEQVPVPPLPEARIANVGDRGEMFFRRIDGDTDRPAVLLIHGWAISSDLNWFAGGFDEAAKNGRRVLAPDVRGHGRGLRSAQPFTLERAADDIAALVEHLDIGPVIVTGYSMGGSLGLLLWERHREVVSGLVLIATSLQWRSNLWERFLWTSLGLVEYGMRYGAPEGGLADRYLRAALEESPELQKFHGWVKAEVRRGDPADIAAAGRSLSTFDSNHLAAQIDVPTVVVVTTQDRLIRPERQVELVEQIPDARQIDIDGHHDAWLVRPERFANAVGEAIALVEEELAGDRQAEPIGA